MIKFVVENDTFLRLIQVVLDPVASEERIEAFAHFCLHDLPDFRGWCDKIRAQAKNIYPIRCSPGRQPGRVTDASARAPRSPSSRNLLSERKKSPPPARTSDSCRSTASPRATSTKPLVTRAECKRVNDPPPGKYFDRGTRLDAHARAGAPSDAERQSDQQRTTKATPATSRRPTIASTRPTATGRASPAWSRSISANSASSVSARSAGN